MLELTAQYQHHKYFTNSANGPSIFQKIPEPVVGSLTPGSQWSSCREGLNCNYIAIYWRQNQRYNLFNKLILAPLKIAYCYKVSLAYDRLRKNRAK